MDVALEICIINKVNHLHERASRTAYSDYISYLETLIKKAIFSIHKKNIQSLATEIYKVLNGLSH